MPNELRAVRVRAIGGGVRGLWKDGMFSSKFDRCSLGLRGVLGGVEGR